MTTIETIGKTRTESYANDIEVVTALTPMACPECGTVYGLSKEFKKQRKGDHRNWFCPNGHSVWYPPPTVSEEDRLREQLEASRSIATRERERRTAAERSRAAYKAQATKVRRRAAHGVCPCCTRTFENLRRHIETQHPDFAADADA